MQLEIILQLLFTNNLQDVVSRAVQIENDIPLPYGPGDKIAVRIYKDKLPQGRKFKDSEGWGVVILPVVAVNSYALNEPYLVTFPNGSSQWVAGDQSTSTVSELVDVEEIKMTTKQ